MNFSENNTQAGTKNKQNHIFQLYKYESSYSNITKRDKIVSIFTLSEGIEGQPRRRDLCVHSNGGDILQPNGGRCNENTC